MSNRKHTGPSPADQQLIRLWDRVEAERSQRGERAALALVNKALAAVQPAQQSGGKEPNQ